MNQDEKFNKELEEEFIQLKNEENSKTPVSPGEPEEEELGGIESGENDSSDEGSGDKEGSDRTDSADVESGQKLPSTATMVGAVGALGLMTLGIGAGLKYLNKKKK